MPVVCTRLTAHGLFLFTDCVLLSGALPMPSACRAPGSVFSHLFYSPSALPTSQLGKIRLLAVSWCKHLLLGKHQSYHNHRMEATGSLWDPACSWRPLTLLDLNFLIKWWRVNPADSIDLWEGQAIHTWGRCNSYNTLDSTLWHTLISKFN